MNQIELAKKAAIEAHQGQTRKMGDDKGKPYIIHPERVAKIVEIELGKRRHYGQLTGWEKTEADNMIAAAWLHDTMEDCQFSETDLIFKGIPFPVINIVKTLTRIEDETYFDFILRIKGDSNACLVKICDIRDNMAGLEEGSRKDKYRFATYILENEI